MEDFDQDTIEDPIIENEEDDENRISSNVESEDKAQLLGLGADHERIHNYRVSQEKFEGITREEVLTKPIQRKYSSIAGMDFTLGNDATPRIQMFCAHQAQRLVFEGMTPKRIINGTEQEFGKYNFRIAVEKDCLIYEVLNYYNQSIGTDSIKHNPKTLVIVQDVSPGKHGNYDVITLEDFCSYHQHFGFPYKDGKDLGKVRKGNFLNKGDVLKETPSTTDNDDYMFGREVKVAMMTHRGASEDGIVICEDILEKFGFDMLEERRVRFGKNTIPLNIYGDNEHYKMFPDIGESIRFDDILMSVRELDEEVAISTQNKNATRIIDHNFDESTYVIGGGVVVNIEVTCNNESEGRIKDVEKQLEKYLFQQNKYYQRLIEIDRKLRAEHGKNYKPSPSLYKLISEAHVGTNFLGKQKITKLYRLEQLDDFNVRFVIKKRVIPTYGFKFTDTRGRKGVCCMILPRDQMPKDKNGVSADIIVDPMACINRMTMGGPIEHGINHVTDVVVNRIKEYLGLNLSSPHVKREIKVMADMMDPRFEKAWNEVTEYLKHIAPESMYPYSQTATQQDKATVITNAIKDTLGLYLPPENSINFAKGLHKLNELYKPLYDKVTYMSSFTPGKVITSKDDVPIADNYIMMLEKIGDEKSSCASIRFQVSGVPATLSKQDRYSEPTRFQPSKFNGESEQRVNASITRPSISAEIHDRNNNPKTAEIAHRNILRAHNPSQIEKLIDRSEYKFNHTRPLQILNHTMFCAGYELIYKFDNPGAIPYFDMLQENLKK